jgi:SulP family sulfate permease
LSDPNHPALHREKCREMRREMRGGIEGALQGVSTLITPALLYMGLLGPLAGAPALWGTLVCVTVVSVFRLLLGGSCSIITAPRTASTATYVALVLHLGLTASAGPVGAGAVPLSAAQLHLGLAAGSLMYLLASLLVTVSGVVGLGRVFKMIPTPVTLGISNGSALLLFTLALGRVLASGWAAAAVAAAMVLGFYAGEWVHRRVDWLRAVPSIVVAIAIGMVGTCVFAGGFGPADTGLSTRILASGAQWTSVLLWSSLDMRQLGALLMLGIPGAITLALVMVLETFTAASVMEMRFDVRSHANRELIALGASNAVSALLGGCPSSGSPVFSIANWMAGGRGKNAAVFCYAFSAVALVALNPWFVALPAGLAAGLLILQAVLTGSASFVQSALDIVRQGRWKNPDPQDLGFWITLIISLVGIFGNLIWACFAGVGLSCLAVLRRVSANLTAHWFYLDSLRSRRVRSVAETEAIAHLAQHVGALRLTGHLFFGNSGRITQLADELHADCVCVVVDLSQVHDVDPSGSDALGWLLRALLKRRLHVVVTGLGKTRALALRSLPLGLPGLEQRVDLDRGLELCEDWLLQNCTRLPMAQLARSIESNDLLNGLSEEEITAVLLVGDMRQVSQGHALFREDEASDGVWMLQSGQVSILAGTGPNAMRLATFGPGQFVGEMGFVDGNSRSATATADSEVDAVLLDRQAIAALVRDHPHAALRITRNIANALSHRVRNTSEVLLQTSDEPYSNWANSSLGSFVK